MSQGPLCPNLTQKVQKEVSQMANRNFSLVILLGGLSVNLNHLITNLGRYNWLQNKLLNESLKQFLLTSGVPRIPVIPF